MPLLKLFVASRDPNITHVAGSIDPIRDIEIINTELCLADLESVEKRKQRIEKIAKSGDKDARAELPLLDRIIEGLGEAKPVRAQGLERRRIRNDQRINFAYCKTIPLYVLTFPKMKYLITPLTNM